MSGEAAAKKLIPPYVPWRTFTNFVEGLKATGVPTHIDKSVMKSMSGGMQSWLLSSLRAMGLINESNIPSEMLRRLVSVDIDKRMPVYKDILKTTYGFLSNGTFDIALTTPTQLDKALQDAGVTGSTIAKSRAFFLSFCKVAGVDVSPHLKKVTRVSTPRKSKPVNTPKRKQAAKAEANPTNDESPFTTRSDSQMLIDLLNTQAMTPEEQDAVWTLIKYLKKTESES